MLLLLPVGPTPRRKGGGGHSPCDKSEGLHASRERGSDMHVGRSATARSVESMSYKRIPDAAHTHSLCIFSYLLRPGRTRTKH